MAGSLSFGLTRPWEHGNRRTVSGQWSGTRFIKYSPSGRRGRRTDIPTEERSVGKEPLLGGENSIYNLFLLSVKASHGSSQLHQIPQPVVSSEVDFLEGSLLN